MTWRLKPVAPGEMLAEEFRKPPDMSNDRLANEIGVPVQRIREVGAGSRAITADADPRLCRILRLRVGWQLRRQRGCDTEVANAGHAKTLAKIGPWQAAMEETADAH